MHILLVCYELHMNSAYEGFYDILESYDHCWAMDNHCLLRTSSNAEDVRNQLYPCIGGHDSLMVCRFSSDWSGISDDAEKWVGERSK